MRESVGHTQRFITNKIVIIIKFGFRKAKMCYIYAHTHTRLLVRLLTASWLFRRLQNHKTESKQTKNEPNLMVISHGTGINSDSGSTFLLYIWFCFLLFNFVCADVKPLSAHTDTDTKCMHAEKNMVISKRFLL